MREERPRPGERYRHFKDKLYQVIAIAIHSETQEELVIYQALYEDFTIYARPLEEFMGEVDYKKYPDVQQKYRFEKVESELKTVHSKRDRAYKTESVVVNPAPKAEVTKKSDQTTESIAKESTVPNRTQILIDFLDCDSYEEKLEYLRDKKKYIDDRMMNDISFALDIVIE